MTLSHRIELDPTVKQTKYFAQACGTARFTWNWALAKWNAQYERGEKPNATALKRQFNAIKYKQFPWMKSVHRDAHAQPFAYLGEAWSQHFQSIKQWKCGEIVKSRIVGKPSFKKKGKCRDSFYVANDKFRLNGRTIRLPVIGWIRLSEKLRFKGKINHAVVSREADRWFVSIGIEAPTKPAPKPAGAPLGVDLGLTTFADLSIGEKTKSPRPLKKALRTLRRLGRWHSRKRLKSQNRRKAAMKLARQHRRVKNVRNDFLHKFTTNLAKSHSEIYIEDLNVRGMLKNHKLAFHVSDAAWSETRRQFEYKTALYGSTLIVRDRFYPSSHLCSVCGEKADKMSLSVRVWICANCGTVHDRDHNAAINLVQNTVGYTGIHASGDCGSGVRETGRETAVEERGTLPCAHIRAQER
jgi:putative transposase